MSNLCNQVFNNFILADKRFSKSLRRFKTYVLVNNNLCGKTFSSLESPKTFDGIFKVTSVLFFMPDFISLRITRFYVLSVILSHFILKQKIKLEYIYSSLWKL